MIGSGQRGGDRGDLSHRTQHRGGFIAQNVAQRYTKASHASLILSTESLFGFLASAVIYGEALSLRTAIGGLMILAAIFVSKLDKTSEQESTEESLA